MWLFVIMEFCVFLILLYLVFDVRVEWKNFIEVNVLEGKLVDFVIYNKFFYLIGDEKYMLLYVQKGDLFDKVVLFQVFDIGVIIIV